jgi:uridine kinase
MHIIGICGSSCSFKSTLAQAILQKYPHQVSIIHMDNYFKDIPSSKRHQVNLDQPCSVDFELLQNHLEQLKNHSAIQSPIFDHFSGRRKQELQTILPNHILILEGILIFHPRWLREMMSEKIYINADEALSLLRKIKRDCLGLGLDINEVLLSFEEQVYPGYQKFIKPCQEYANLIIQEDDFGVMLNQLDRTIHNYL